MHKALLTDGDPYDLGPGIFCYREPLVFKRSVVKVPKGLELKVLKADAGIGFGRGLIRDSENVIEETVRRQGLMTVYEFTARKVPPVPPAENLPHWHNFTPVVLLLTASGRCSVKMTSFC